LQVEGGQLDVDVQLASNLVAQMQSNPHAKPQIVPSTAIRYMQPNHQVAPFGDLKVRQAINAAIDREAIVKAVYSSYATPANSFLPKGMLDYDASIPTPKVDLTLARKLLSQSSVPHGFTMTYETHAGDVADNQIAVLFQQQMAPLNIKVNIKPVDPTALATANQAFKFNFIGQYWTNDIPDPDELVSYSVDYTQAVKSYYTHYNNPTLTKLSQQAATTIDPGARRQLYFRIQEIFAKQVPFFAIAYLPFINGVSTGVKGFSQNPLGYFVLQGVTKS
jgi:peptide/nickel transport system substrate-binding protein